MAISPQLQNEGEVKVDFQKILQKQEAFKKKTGKYFQVLKGAKQPSEEKEKVDMTDIPVDIEIHEHQSNNGVGFTIIERKTENGKDYIKQTGHGEGSETFDWREEVKEKSLWQT